VSSHELIRFPALSANNSVQTYVITGDGRVLAPYLMGMVVMRAKAEYLVKDNDAWPDLRNMARALQAAISSLIKLEKNNR